MAKQLQEQRKKKDNQLGKGGFLIELKNPKDFQNTMDLILAAPDKNLDENKIMVQHFDTKNATQNSQAQLTMAVVLQGDIGADVIDD